MATIQDVARAAGVSTATVSRTLSSPDLVTKATRTKVIAAVDRLGYSPNVAAKNLRTSKTNKILVAVPDISNPFFSQVIRGVEEAASAAGYSVLLGDTRFGEEHEEQLAAMLRRKEADGLIFLGHRLPGSLANLAQKLGALSPIVNGCEYSPDLGVPSAHIDNERAAAEVMEHLYALGHRRIGIVTGPLGSPLSGDRLAGVQAAAARTGNWKLNVVEGDFTIESGHDRTLELLDAEHPPTAIFCFSDEMAMGALGAIRERDLTCPEQISLVGFDDIRFARHLHPPLTTVSQPMETIGKEVVKLLLQVLSGETDIVRHVTLAHKLVVRGSTATPPPA